MTQSQPSPSEREQMLADVAWWLWHRVYEYELVGPRRRTGLSGVEMDKFISMGNDLHDARAAMREESPHA